MTAVSSHTRTPTAFLCCYLILKKQDRVCLLLRKNTGYCDGFYGLIAGHAEEGESATEAMIREAKEEAGLHLEAAQLKLVHVMHCKTNRLNINFFFEYAFWPGDPQNCEPDKCENIALFPLADLPENTMDFVAYACKASSRGEFYSEIGFK